MTKEVLIDLIILNTGNDGKLHRNQVHLNAVMAWEQMLMAVYSQVPDKIDRFAKRYKGVAVAKEVDTGLYYSELPITPIRFSDTAEGLRRVIKPKQQSNRDGDETALVPIPYQHVQFIPMTDAGKVAGVSGYYIRDEKVYYFLMDENITEVMMDIVPSLEKMDWEDEVIIPSGGVQMLIGITQEILTGTPYVHPRLRKINLSEV